MNEETPISELLDLAARSEGPEFDVFFKKVAALGVQHQQTALPKKESDLLQKINRQFPDDQWQRLDVLNDRLEYETLTEGEYVELMLLGDEYEAHIVQRVRYLGRLAALRKVSLEELIEQLGIAPQTHD